MTILVTGGRDYADADKVFSTLNAIHAETPIDRLVHGGASGADALASQWAVARRIKAISSFPADWDDLSHPDALVRTRRDGTKYNAAAGPIRNQKMIEETKPDLVVAFFGGNGTKDCVRRALAAGIPVQEVKP